MKMTCTRRSILQAGVGAATALAVTGVARAAKPPTGEVLKRLDTNLYIHNMELHANYFPGQAIGPKIQMMSVGKKRYLYHTHLDADDRGIGRCLDVTDPLDPQVVGDQLFQSHQPQVAYSHAVRRWVLMTSESAVDLQIDMTRGKNVGAKGLRGIRLYDVTNPEKAEVLSEWSTDQGDPKREVQEGSATHRNFYTGGRYAYLDTAPDNTYTNYEFARANGVQVIDLLDPAKPKFVTNIWIPGQRKGEEVAYAAFPFAGNKLSIPSLHGGFIVPENVEDGGRYGYGAWGALGVRVHDVSDIRSPKQVGSWNSKDVNGGGFRFHTVDVSRLDSAGIALVNPEMIRPQCADAWYDSYVLDARDPAHWQELSTLPVPNPDADAPYPSFCQKLGRFGPHNTAHHKAPGRAKPDWTCYTYFNAGLQCYDLRDPRNPRISASFIPPQSGSLDHPGTFARDTDSVFVEWDRKLIWIGTGTGLYLLSTPGLGEPSFAPAGVREWSLPSLRRHWPTERA